MNPNFIVTGLIFVTIGVAIAVSVFLLNPFGTQSESAISFSVILATTGSVVACIGLVANNKGAGEE